MIFEYYPSSHDASASDIQARVSEYLPAHGATIERDNEAIVSISRGLDFSTAEKITLDAALQSLGYMRT